jgi:hypothetical protein
MCLRRSASREIKKENSAFSIDIIGNNPQISPITQVREFSKEKSVDKQN